MYLISKTVFLFCISYIEHCSCIPPFCLCAFLSIPPPHGRCRRKCQGTSPQRQRLGFQQCGLPFHYLASLLPVLRHGTKWAPLTHRSSHLVSHLYIHGLGLCRLLPQVHLSYLYPGLQHAFRTEDLKIGKKNLLSQSLQACFMSWRKINGFFHEDEAWKSI